MRIPGWLRQAVADFFHAASDETDAQARQIGEELEELRSLTLLAVAQARRTELELHDALSAGSPDHHRLAELIARLEEERSRANNLMERYRRREGEEEERLSRLGQLRLADEINERRQQLRGAVERASRAAHEDELIAMEDEARAEAFRLDLLEQFDAGETFEREAAPDEDSSTLTEQARELLAKPAIRPSSEE